MRMIVQVHISRPLTLDPSSDYFNQFTGQRSRYKDNVAAWPSVEPTLDYTVIALYMFARENSTAHPVNVTYSASSSTTSMVSENGSESAVVLFAFLSILCVIVSA